jgi:predicted ATPase
MSPRFVVITGGPGSGKTSVVDHLASLGYATVPESGIQIIEELNRERGVAGQVAWRQGHPAEFTRLVFDRLVALEEACEAARDALVFCDRGRPDTLAYAADTGVVLGEDYLSLIHQQRYLEVYLLDTLSRFPERSATGRTSDRARSVRLHDLLDVAYRSLGYRPVPVPELSIEERARFVLSDLGERG